MNNTTLQIVTTIPSSILYYMLNNKLRNIQIRKIANNSTSAIHEIFTIIIFCYNYLLNGNALYLMQINTGGFFIFDFFRMLIENKYNIPTGMYLYHHITVYFWMLLNPNESYWPFIMFFSELSNIPTLFVYHYIQKDRLIGKKYISEKTKYAKKIQMWFYGFFRIFILGYYGICEYNKNPHSIPVKMAGLLYFFGLIWSGFMIKQNLSQ